MMTTTIFTTTVLLSSKNPSPSQGERRERVAVAQVQRSCRVSQLACIQSLTRLLLLLALSIAVPAIADEPAAPKSESSSAEKSKPAPAKQSLNDELLKGLGSDPSTDPIPAKTEGKADAAGGAKDSGANQNKAADGAKPAKKGVGDSLDDELLKGLEGGQEAQAEGDASDPLVRINRQMRKVESLIARTKADTSTQQLQQKIVRDLDELIKKVQQQKSSSSSSAQCASQQRTARRDKVAQPGAEQGKKGPKTPTSPPRKARSSFKSARRSGPIWTNCKSCWARACGGSFPRKSATRCCSRRPISICPSTNC